METLQTFVSREDQLIYPVDILKPSAPRTRSGKCKEAINNESSGLLARRSFEYVKRSKFKPKEGRFVLDIKETGTGNERYK